MKMENITKEMINKCKDKYLSEAIEYIFATLCGVDEKNRPLHCTDPSRNNYLLKIGGDWKKDIGAIEIKSRSMPIITKTYDAAMDQSISEKTDKLCYIEAKLKSHNSVFMEKECSKALGNMKTSH